jgi:uncharacterized membrane protein YfcA
MTLTFLALLTAACLIGSTISGVIGMAGGIFLLTVMLLMGLPIEVAIPLHAAIQLASNSTRVLAYWKHVRWTALRPFILVALPLPLLGLQLVSVLDEQLTKAIIGFVVLIAAWAPKGGLARLSERYAFGIAGALAGTLGVVIGAVGPIIAPFMLREGWENEEIIATKAAGQSFIHMQKLVAFGAAGYALTDFAPQLPPLVVAVVIGTFIGKWLLQFLTKERFRLAYRVVLSLIALRLISSII